MDGADDLRNCPSGPPITTSMRLRPKVRGLEEPDGPITGAGVPPPVKTPVSTGSPEEEIGTEKQAHLNAAKLQEGSRNWQERLVDENAELDQDAARLGRNALGGTYVKMPPGPPPGVIQKAQTEGINASLSRAIPKDPISDGRLAQFQSNARGGSQPKTQRRQRVLFGGAPKNMLPHRPAGPNAVTVC